MLVAPVRWATPTRKAITVQDLRATGITWRAICCGDPLKIMHCAGYTSFQTTQIYVAQSAFGQASAPSSLPCPPRF